MINLTLLLPQRKEAFLEIEIKLDREIVIERAKVVQLTVDIIVYLDTLGREGYLGTIVAALNNLLEIIDSI